MIRQRTMGPKRENWDGWGCMLISAGDKMAKAFLSQIKQELEQNTDLQRSTLRAREVEWRARGEQSGGPRAGGEAAAGDVGGIGG